LLGRGQRQHLGSRARTAANLAHGGGNIARSLNAFKRSRHICQKTHENPRPGALSYHVVHAPARSARPVPGRAGRGVANTPGDNVDNKPAHATDQLTYTLKWQGGGVRRR
jgi:hypothetical protein